MARAAIAAAAARERRYRNRTVTIRIVSGDRMARADRRDLAYPHVDEFFYRRVIVIAIEVQRSAMQIFL